VQVCIYLHFKFKYRTYKISGFQHLHFHPQLGLLDYFHTNFNNHFPSIFPTFWDLFSNFLGLPITLVSSGGCTKIPLWFLPINILLGPTYKHKLWCVFQLCSSSTQVSMDQSCLLYNKQYHDDMGYPSTATSYSHMSYLLDQHNIHLHALHVFSHFHFSLS
jgi:hypothetical protein